MRRSGTIVHKCSIKKLFWKISQNSEENIFTGVVTCQDAGLDLAIYHRRESKIGVLLWNLWNLSKQLHAEQLRTAAFWHDYD